MERLLSLFEIVDAQIETINADRLPDLKRRLREAQDDLPKKAGVLGEYFTMTGAINFLFQWYAVMIVTMAETYLHDILSYCAKLDPVLMEASELKTTYQDLLSAESLESLAAGMRDRWAQNFISDGGPSRWVEGLSRMGARGWEDGLIPRLERLWGVRHIVVHRNGVVNQDFLDHHPDLGYKIGEDIKVDGDFVRDYAIAVISFCKTVDRFFHARYKEEMATDPEVE